MKKLFHKIKENKLFQKLNNKGMTLTEMLVSFALLALFLVAVSEVISYTVTTYYNARNVSYGMEVASLVKNQVAKELYNCQGNPKLTTVDLGGTHMDSVQYENSDGTTVTMKVENGLFVISYPENSKYEATDWYYGSKAYMNYKITNFQLASANDVGTGTYDSNVMYLSMTVLNELNGFEYTAESYIKCYNADNIE